MTGLLGVATVALVLVHLLFLNRLLARLRRDHSQFWNEVQSSAGGPMLAFLSNRVNRFVFNREYRAVDDKHVKTAGDIAFWSAAAALAAILVAVLLGFI